LSEITPNIGLTTGFNVGESGWGDPVSENFRVIDTAVAAMVSWASLLAGYAVGANEVLDTDDTLLGALGKLQGQINTKRGYAPNTTATGPTLTPVAGNDFYARTAQDVALDFVNPSGTWPDGDGFVARIKDDGVARALSFGSKYRAVGQPSLPTITTAGKTMYIAIARNAAEDKFDVFPAQIIA
jgi:hypothetical protein